MPSSRAGRARAAARPRRLTSGGGQQTAAARKGRPPSDRRYGLDVVVEGELVRMRPQPYGIHLVLPLVVDPGLDEIRREDVALEEEGMVLLEVVQHDVERPRKLLDPLLLGRRQLIEILVHGLSGIDLVGHAVQAGHYAGGEREVRI